MRCHVSARLSYDTMGLEISSRVEDVDYVYQLKEPNGLSGSNRNLRLPTVQYSSH